VEADLGGLFKGRGGAERVEESMEVGRRGVFPEGVLGYWDWEGGGQLEVGGVVSEGSPPVGKRRASRAVKRLEGTGATGKGPVYDVRPPRGTQRPPPVGRWSGGPNPRGGEAELGTWNAAFLSDLQSGICVALTMRNAWVG
jgi:hypothetical protein